MFMLGIDEFQFQTCNPALSHIIGFPGLVSPDLFCSIGFVFVALSTLPGAVYVHPWPLAPAGMVGEPGPPPGCWKIFFVR